MNQAKFQTRPAGLLARLGSLWKSMSPHPSPVPDQLLPPSENDLPQRHQDALAVLTAARTMIQRGWVQNTWYVTQTPGGRRHNFGPLSGRLDHTRIVQSCVVGAVLHAAWQQSPRPEHANPAIDALWLNLFQPAGPASTEPVGPVSSPPVRVARVRDLTTWNDRRDRTRDDVLQLLDRTTARIAGAQHTAG